LIILTGALLEKQEKQRVLMVAELKDAIQAGIKSGPGIPAEEVLVRLEHKYAAMKKGSHG
jgi:antitoxin ParD1/3/4